MKQVEDRIKKLEAWQAEAKPLLKVLWCSLEYKKRVDGAGLDALKLRTLEESMLKIEKLFEPENNE